MTPPWLSALLGGGQPQVPGMMPGQGDMPIPAPSMPGNPATMAPGGPLILPDQVPPPTPPGGPGMTPGGGFLSGLDPRMMAMMALPMAMGMGAKGEAPPAPVSGLPARPGGPTGQRPMFPNASATQPMPGARFGR